ncbi:MAG: hypothetical protein ACRD9S_23810 [Pyrinomonadaceae bacterium]
METPQVKSEIVRAIQDLPEDATVEDAMERLYFLAKIERGLEQSESDETLSHEEIKARFLRSLKFVGPRKQQTIFKPFTTSSDATRRTTLRSSSKISWLRSTDWNDSR